VPQTSALALEAHDLAAVKVMVARPKDLNLVRRLLATGVLTAEVVRDRILLLPGPAEGLPRPLAALQSMIQ
jgi:hypothetical protein